MSLTLHQIRRQLKNRGLKLTTQRYAIYRALAASKRHPSAEELYATVKNSHPGLSLNTVYNALEALKEAGAAAEISPWRDRARFDANFSSHHHLVCLGCKHIEDFYDKALDRLIVSPTVKRHFRITGHRVEFQGYCKACKNKQKAKSKTA